MESILYKLTGNRIHGFHSGRHYYGYSFVIRHLGDGGELCELGRHEVQTGISVVMGAIRERCRQLILVLSAIEEGAGCVAYLNSTLTVIICGSRHLTHVLPHSDQKQIGAYCLARY